MGRTSPTVAVASADPRLLDEVIRSLEELPHWRVVASVATLSELLALVSESVVQVVLCDGAIAREWAAAGGTKPSVAIVVFDRITDEATLLASLDLGAAGFASWPAQRQRMRDLVERTVASQPRLYRSKGEVVGLWSPKGGAGTTTLAAHLAVALAPTGATTLVDLDFEHADQTAMFGAEAHKKTSADLLRVLDEIHADTIDSVAFGGPGDLKMVLSPGVLGNADMIKPTDAVTLVGHIAESCRFLVADLPSSNLELAHGLLESSTRFFLVVTPDLLSLKRARDAMKVLKAGGTRLEHVSVIVNQYTKGDVNLDQVEALTGCKVAAKVRPDLGMSKAAGRGEPSASGLRLMATVASEIAGTTDSGARRWRLGR